MTTNLRKFRRQSRLSFAFMLLAKGAFIAEHESKRPAKKAMMGNLGMTFLV